MRVWLVKDAEPLPLDGVGGHRMRMGRLAEALLARGHEVEWWHSTFYHFTKAAVWPRGESVSVRPGYRLRLLDAGRYGGNLSLSRYRHHVRLGGLFLREAVRCEPPDAIVAAFPIPQFAHAAARFAESRGVPLIVDVRDLWPDVFVHKSPRVMRPIARLATRRMDREVGWLMAQADSLVAVTEGYLDWAVARAARKRREGDRVLPLGYPRVDESSAAGRAPRVADLRRELAGRLVVAFTGSFGRSYDLMTVCEAAAHLARLGREDIHFVLAGDGEQGKALHRRARGLSNVTMTGWLEKPEMDALLTVADLGLVCCISVDDTLPNKVFQYLASGLPLLSSLRGEGERLIATNDVGLSYRAGDAGALVAAILELADDPEARHRQAANARRLFDARYDAGMIDADYARHVESIANRGLRTPNAKATLGVSLECPVVEPQGSQPCPTPK